jgi:hypothetical protein
VRFEVVATFLAAAVIVWAFAIIGVMTVAGAVVGGPEPSREAGLLEAANRDVDGWDIRGLGRPPESVRSEHRMAVWGAVAAIEVEYRSTASVGDALRHYGSAFRDGGWRVVNRAYQRGEWVIDATSDSREARVEIERVDDVTEVEIEILEPASEREGSSDR